MKLFNLGTRVVNNYLISTEIGYILIDTGYEGGFKHFTNKLNSLHISPKDIRHVFLTHAHDDHAGFLNEVLAAAPKTIYPAHGKPFPASDLQKYLPSLDNIQLRPLKS